MVAKSHAHHKKMAEHHKEKAKHHMEMAREAKGGKKEYGSMDKKPLAHVAKRGRGKDKL